ncbi:MAG: DUF4198 domain-containing protein [Rhodobacteraceae bacterium]|nr:DUF4198 domain-containing protein [Paracoccaceae bacterium]
MRKDLLIWAATALSLACVPTVAHEFWIAPQSYHVAPGEALIADLRVGTEFDGSAYAFVPANFKRFEVMQGNTTVPVTGRPGDMPALNQQLDGRGLVTVVHVTRDYSLRYNDWQTFVNFVEHKDFAGALERHRVRGLPQTGFTELYGRYAKSLIAFGGTEGSDRAVGLETEIIALTNPYDLGATHVEVLVTYQGQARSDTQVELFERAPDGSVATTYHRTGPDGRLSLPIKPAHEYLVDAVVLRERIPEAENDPVWESLWASLTFKIPG